MEPGTEDGDDVTIHWKNDLHPGHTTRFSPREWYLQHRAAQRRMSLGPKVAWDGDQMDDLKSMNLNVADYGAFLSDEVVLERMLIHLRDYGLGFFTGVPSTEIAVEKLGERIGPLKHTFYGRTWDVKDKPRAENVAYTSGDLELHMDLL